MDVRHLSILTLVLLVGTAVSAAERTVSISFQPPIAPVQDGWKADCGAVFAAHDGLSYGWNAPNPTAYDRGRTTSPDQTYDTLVHLQRPESPAAVWEIAVPPGFYHVQLICGDATYTNSVYRVAVEDQVLVDGTPGPGQHWLVGVGVVEVRDGRLSITSAPGAVNNKLCGVQITLVVNNG